MSCLLKTDLRVRYGRGPEVLRGCRLEIAAGSIYGIAGSSGSGKSTLGLALLGLLRDATVEGSIWFDGQERNGMREREWQRLRGHRLALVPQSPLSSLNPRLRIGAHFEEAWAVHEPRRKREWREVALGALASAQLPAEPKFLRLYPGQLSVGMAQRVLIALAVIHQPKLLIADEATSALDVISQAGVLELFRNLRDSLGLCVVFITHDLLAAAAVCDRIGVLHEGIIVEEGSPDQLLVAPRHPYVQSLVAALAPLGRGSGLGRLRQVLASEGGAVPVLPDPAPTRR